MSYTFYTTHEKQLTKIIEDYKKKILKSENELFTDTSISHFKRFENEMFSHKLRSYQMEALYILDAFYTKHDTDKEITKLYEKLLEPHGKENPVKIPFLGYEMATGSGKTTLMGACICYLLEQGIKNFLIITPKSLDIYNKTIRNFTKGGPDSIWEKDAPVKFNLITGDDYNHLYINSDKEFNIFIFNIDKFGPNATKTSKAWESSYFKDKNGNTISVKEFLESEDLAIITDEAHHAQSQKDGGSGNIIKNFRPKIVLEFTATALEDTKSDEKRAQKVVYKYDIKKFLENKFGKRIKAVALDTESIKLKKKSEIPDNEKWKLITLYLFHILKKKAVLLSEKTKNLKPLAFVKVKDDSKYAEKIYNYIVKELPSDEANIKIILEKIKVEEIDVVPILKQVLEESYQYDFEKIKKELERLTAKTLLYSGDLDKEQKEGFAKIQTNLYESVVYIKRLDEGIDLPNIYSIAVINDNDSDFKTSVKQIIGRGVRLAKLQREYDAEHDLLQAQSEILHIICDRGKNFQKVIDDIRAEFDLDEFIFSNNSKHKVTVTNKVKKDLLFDKKIPIIKASDKIKKDVSLDGLMADIDVVVHSYIQHNCAVNSEKSSVYLKFIPTSFFTIIDIFSDDATFLNEMQKNGIPSEKFQLNEEDYKEIFTRIVKRVPHVPDSDKYKNYVKGYIDLLLQKEFYFFKSDEADTEIAKRKMKDSFCYFFDNYIHKHYYQPDYKQIHDDQYLELADVFRDYEITLSSDAIGDKQKKKLEPILQDRAKMIDLIKQGFYFYGYKHSLYDYTRFDSYTEKQLADFLEYLIQNSEFPEKYFWVKSERQFHFQYGNQRYFPDFLFHYSDMMNVIETKAEAFSNQKKNALLEKVNGIDGYRGLLIFSDQMDTIERNQFADSFNYLLGASNQSFHYKRFDGLILPSVEEEKQFKEYLPYFTIHAAAGDFSDTQESKPRAWIPVQKRNYTKTSFVVQVKGHSMSPLIYDGDMCIFDNFYAGTKNGKVVLVQHRDIHDPENGGKYTVKQYYSSKIQSEEELIGNYKIELKPVNLDYPVITLDKVLENEVRFIGVFVERLIIATNSI
ncbi:MAG: DEAD/DEAH box helicase family protein [Leptospiraceae bacterium]|nr:DEAD/DEAH box helicase family protein [Leptospiraceae bacterium]